MKRYYVDGYFSEWWAKVQRGISDKAVDPDWPFPVYLAADAEAEIKKARRDRFSGADMIRARADERERIMREVEKLREAWHGNIAWDMVLKAINPAPGPKLGKTFTGPVGREEFEAVVADLAAQIAGGLCTQGEMGMATRKEFWVSVFIEILRKNGEKGTVEKAVAEADLALVSFDKISDER